MAEPPLAGGAVERTLQGGTRAEADARLADRRSVSRTITGRLSKPSRECGRGAISTGRGARKRNGKRALSPNGPRNTRRDRAESLRTADRQRLLTASANNLDFASGWTYLQSMTFLLYAGFVLVFLLLGTAIWGSFKKSPTELRQQQERRR